MGKTLTPSRGQVIAGLVKYARPLILADFEPNSCVASTRVALEVLRYFDIPAKELAVSVMIFNEKAWGHLPEIDAGKKMTDFHDGSWSVGIDNHLVAVATDSIVVDLSLDQANRPGRDGMMGFTPAWFEIPNDLRQPFLSGMETIQFTRPIDRTTISFLAKPGNRFYRTSPDWLLRRRWKSIVGAVIRSIRALDTDQVGRHMGSRRN